MLNRCVPHTRPKLIRYGFPRTPVKTVLGSNAVVAAAGGHVTDRTATDIVNHVVEYGTIDAFGPFRTTTRRTILRFERLIHRNGDFKNEFKVAKLRRLWRFSKNAV